MALELITEDNSGLKAFIFTDNYAAILSSEQPKQQSGHTTHQEFKTLPGQLEVH